MSFRTALAALALATAVVSAHADTITLDTANSSGGTYQYNYTQTTSGLERFNSGSVFTITGLSGVTGASTNIPSVFTASFTSTSASFTVNGSTFFLFNVGTYSDVFALTSSVSTLGAAQYSIPTTPTATTGTVQGPVASAVTVTPEPSSLLLLGTGVLGMVGAVRRRFV